MTISLYQAGFPDEDSHMSTELRPRSLFDRVLYSSWLIPAVVCAFIANVIFLIVQDTLPEKMQYVGISILAFLRVILFTLLAIAFIKKYRSSTVRAWKIMGIAIALWIPGQILYSIFVFVRQDPHLSVQFFDLFAFFALTIGLVGATLLGFYGLSTRERIQILLNAFTLGSCIAFIGVVFIVEIIIQGNVSTLEEQYVNLVFFTIDVLFISLAVSIMLYRGFEKVYLPFGISLIGLAFADICFSFGLIYGRSWEVPIRTVQILFAAIWFYAVRKPYVSPTKPVSLRGENQLVTAAYLAVFFASVFSLASVVTSQTISRVSLVSFLVMFIAILLTQFVGYRENKRLQKIQQDSIEVISKSEERYQELATHDTLTHLSNRTFFIEQLSDSLKDLKKTDAPVAVMFIDLDRFKEINDTYGHSKGDDVIKTVAQRITDVVDEQGTVCRLGGDEFAILIPSPAEREQLVVIANHLLEAVIAPIDLAGQETYLTCSVGIALSTEEEKDPQVLLRNADTAMYRAKELGRNRIEFADGFIKPVLQMTGWSLSDLHRGLVQDEITVYYQPIIDMKTNKINGYEALARWEHPYKGAISPEEFIPVAEDNGLIIELGDGILQQALDQLHEWDTVSGSLHLSMHINLSLRQLNDETFLTDLLRYCQERQVDPHRIHFEMTESSLLGDVRSAMATLREMQSHGFNLHIDDFGTGYSSLSYLKKFPITGFKIDKTFIRGYGVEEDDTAIVRALITLGSSLGLVVTAEGVQSIETRDSLAELGCAYAQGYLFAEPLPADRIVIAEDIPNNVTKIRGA